MTDRLPPGMLDQLAQATLFVSPLTRAEIGIKHALGKLPLPRSESTFWNLLVSRIDARELPFASHHAAELATMPLHHRDPFDRMILAQALAEDLTVATTDAVFARYGVRVLGVRPIDPPAD